jgi:hypothetical protein
MSGFREFTPTGGTEEKDETYKRVVGKKHVPDIDKGSLMFRLVSANPADFGHYMKFWLNIGMRDNGKHLTIPRVSRNAFPDFIVSDGRGGTRVARTAAAIKGCRLSQLAENNHPVIALSEYKDSKGNFKKNIDSAHVARIQLIERKRDAQQRAMKNADGSPAFVVKPEEMFLEMPQSWWDQFVNIIDPVAGAAAGADDDLRGETKKVKALPTTDLTRVIWMMTKEKRTKNPTGNAKVDVDYVLDFASSTTIKDADMVAVAGPLEMSKAFVYVDDADLTRWMAAAEAGWPKGSGAQQSGAPSAEDDPDSYGQRLVVPAAAGSTEDELFR